MKTLDLFNSKFERNLHEGATDSCTSSADVNAQMKSLVERARACSTMEERACLMREYAALKETAKGYSLPASQLPGKQELLKTPVTGFEKAKAAVKDTVKGMMGRKDVDYFGSGRSVDENWDSGDIKDTQPDSDIEVKNALRDQLPTRAQTNSPAYRQKMIADLTAQAQAGDKGAAATLAAFKRSGVAEAQKKSSEDLGSIKDPAVQQAIKQARVRFPSADSDVEAFVKDTETHLDQDEQDIDHEQELNSRQEAMLQHIMDLDKKQSTDINDIKGRLSNINKRLNTVLGKIDLPQGVAETRRLKGADLQLKLVDRQEDDATDLDDVVTDYYFDVYQNGQKVGHAYGDSYYGELVVKADFNREFKLDTFRDKDHPLIQQFEKFQQQLNEFAPGGGGDDTPEQEQPSKVALAVERLVNGGAQVQVSLSGVRGRVAWVDVKPDGTTEIQVQFRNLDKKPTPGNTLSLELDRNDDATLNLEMSGPKEYTLTGSYKRKDPMRHIGGQVNEFAPGGGEDDDSYMLKLVKPGYYQLWDKSIANAGEQGVAEADETSWTANSAQFRKEEDMSWTFKIAIEPNADINKGRGRQEVTKIVSGQSMDAAKKKIREYYLRNGWEVVGIEQVMPEMFAPAVALRQPAKKELTPSQQKSADRDVKLLGKYRDKDLGINAAMDRLEKFKQKHQKTDEGWSGNEPTWVCVNGKRWKKFPTDDHARNVGNKLQAKLRQEGRKDVVSYDHDLEDLEEVSKQTLGSYVKKAGQDVVQRATSSSYQSGAAGDKYNRAEPGHKELRRERGIERAVGKLTK